MRRIRVLRVVFLVLAFTGLSSGRASYVAARIVGEGLADPTGQSPRIAPESCREEARSEDERSSVRNRRYIPSHVDLGIYPPLILTRVIASSEVDGDDTVALGSSVDITVCQPARAGPLPA